MVLTTTVEEADREKDASIMSREEVIIIPSVEIGRHHQTEEEEAHDTLLTQLIDPRCIVIILTLTMFE